MKYTLFNVHGGMLDADKEIEASSPIKAVRKFYRNVRRSRDNGGDIVVHSANGCYAYYVGMKKEINYENTKKKI